MSTRSWNVESLTGGALETPSARVVFFCFGVSGRRRWRAASVLRVWGGARASRAAFGRRCACVGATREGGGRRRPQQWGYACLCAPHAAGQRQAAARSPLPPTPALSLSSRVPLETGRPPAARPHRSGTSATRAASATRGSTSRRQRPRGRRRQSSPRRWDERERGAPSSGASTRARARAAFAHSAHDHHGRDPAAADADTRSEQRTHQRGG